MRDLGWTVPAHGKADCAQPGIGVERKAAHSIEAPDILPAQVRQVDGTVPWKPDLAAVGVTRELQINRKSSDYVGIVGLVREQHRGFVVGDGVQCLGKVGGTAEYV